ncbi:MAG: pyridoxal phosphate-dependent aminotransferase, partial [Spirochaetia bacterium]
DVRSVLRRLNMDTAGMEKLLIDKARVWLEAGSCFGASGEGFLRMNIGCSRVLLRQALEKIKTVLVE